MFFKILLCTNAPDPPKILHTYSIDTPYMLHRNDGLSMDYRWIIDGLSLEEEHKNDKDNHKSLGL